MPDPVPPPDGGGHPGRGDRPVPQRLARLARPRPGHRPAARAGPRVRRRGGGGRRRGDRLAARRPGDRAVRLRLRACPPCLAGDQQVCERQTQPGFTHWGSFAEYVAVEHADVNLVRLPDGVDVRRRGRASAAGSRRRTARWSRQGRVARRRVGRGPRLRRRRAVRGDDRRRGRRPRGRRRHRAAAALGLARRLGRRRLDAADRTTWPPPSRAHRRRRAPLARRARQPGHLRPRRCAACAAAGGTCRSACCRRRRAPDGADGPGHRLRAGAARQPRHAGARVPGDARARHEPGGCGPTTSSRTR